jgi:hypothetical protein
MNQRQPPASIQMPFDLAVFRRPADSQQKREVANFAPESSYQGMMSGEWFDVHCVASHRITY